VTADLGLVADAAERHADELASGRACDRLADRGLARSGRSDEGQDGAGLLVLCDAALLPELPHGDVLDDAVLHVLEPGVVGVEHLARVYGIEPLVGALRPRNGDQPVEVGADHRALARLLAHALEPAELALGLLADLVRHAGLGDLLAVLLDHRAVVVAELLLDRLHLLAQEVLALLLLRARLHVVADLAADLHLGQPLALKLQRATEPFGHVEDLEELDLLLVGQIGGIAGGVGESARLDDRADERRDAAVVAAELEELLDHRAVLALELTGLAVDGLVVGVRFDLDVQVAVGTGLRGADATAVLALEGDRATAAGEADAVGHLGHRADRGELVALARNEDDPLLRPDIDCKRHCHGREDDRIVHRDQQHRLSFLTHDK
jgi:hypothetical protein